MDTSISLKLGSIARAGALTALNVLIAAALWMLISVVVQRVYKEEQSRPVVYTVTRAVTDISRDDGGKETSQRRIEVLGDFPKEATSTRRRQQRDLIMQALNRIANKDRHITKNDRFECEGLWNVYPSTWFLFGERFENMASVNPASCRAVPRT